MSSTNCKFTLNLADGWQDRTVHYFMGPEEGGVEHALTLVVDPTPSSDDLETYAHERAEQAIESLPVAEVVKDEAITLASGTPAYEVVIKWVPGEERPLFRRMIFLMAGETAYTFTADFSKRTLKTISVQVLEMISNFKPGV
ncbi:MAG: DcrB-related protein [candidate division Zixibacteria bacterium]|nr:DcrB-related protein [candidate division Zixibacteria bacterium]